MAEHRPCKLEIVGSSPAQGSSFFLKLGVFFAWCCYMYVYIKEGIQSVSLLSPAHQKRLCSKGAGGFGLINGSMAC